MRTTGSRTLVSVTISLSFQSENGRQDGSRGAEAEAGANIRRDPLLRMATPDNRYCKYLFASIEADFARLTSFTGYGLRMPMRMAGARYSRHFTSFETRFFERPHLQCAPVIPGWFTGDFWPDLK